jgi:hypothetical protein
MDRGPSPSLSSPYSVRRQERRGSMGSGEGEEKGGVGTEYFVFVFVFVFITLLGALLNRFYF